MNYCGTTGCTNDCAINDIRCKSCNDQITYEVMLGAPTPMEDVVGSLRPTKSDGSTASYYELPERATQLQDLIGHKDMNAQIGEIFRACYRYGEVEHSEKMRDAKKIKFYAAAALERLEKL